MSGKWVQITAQSNEFFDAYFTKPSKGSGPGVILLQEIFGVNESIRNIANYYAEEGYVVLAPDMFWRLDPRVELGYDPKSFNRAAQYYKEFDQKLAIQDIQSCLSYLRTLPECIGRVGALGFCLGGKLVHLAAGHTDIDCGVSYYGVGIEHELDLVNKINCPMAYHFGENDEHITTAAVEQIEVAFNKKNNVDIYKYSESGHGFANSNRDSFVKPDSMMAHSRSVALFRASMGPFFNLSELWDEHCYYEFGVRDVDETMRTMVNEPYVNHIPTMTGGVGFKDLKQFYTDHFIFSNPVDIKLIPISRTIGSDRIVDELLFCFTHDREVDWMLPGLEPTGKYVEIPLVAIVCFRGGKIYNEHIYWDQASVLVQIGILDSQGLPIAGSETAKKLLDETLPSNELMHRR